MSDAPAERFVAATTRSLADPQLRLAAERTLREGIARLAGRILHGDPLEAAATRMEGRSDRRRFPLWTVMLGLGVILSAVMMATAFRERAVTYHRNGRGTAAHEEALARNLTPPQRLLIFGDTSKSLPSDRTKALWDSDPGNPAYFAEYSVRYLVDHDSLPADFLETAATLDPDNGWFPALAAGVEAKGSVEIIKRSDEDKALGLAPGWKLEDPERAERALGLLHQALQRPRFDSYEGHLLRQRYALLPQRRDFLDQVYEITYAAGQPSHLIRLMSLPRVLAAKAAQPGLDAVTVKALIDDWEKLSRRVANDAAGLPSTLVASAVLTTPAANLRDASKEAGLPKQALRLEWIDQWHRAYRNARKQRDASGGVAQTLEHAGIFARMLVPNATKANPALALPTEQELKPERLSNHALLGEIEALLKWLILALCLATAGACLFAKGRIGRLLSAELIALLRPVDWCWILLGGVVAPFAWFLLITRLTPLGGRDWFIGVNHGIVPGVQASALAWLLIRTPGLFASWRFGQRAETAGLGGPPPWPAWLSVVAAFLAIPTIGASLLTEANREDVTWAGIALMGLALLVALGEWIGALFSPPASPFRLPVIARTLLVAYPLAMIPLATAVALLYREEQHWISRDRLVEISADEPAAGRYEFRAARALRDELMEVLDTKY